jgi:hypothetical protein
MRETCKTVHLKRLLEQAYKSFPLLAQLVEQWTVVPFVTCSIQVERTFSPIAQLVERATVNRKVIGSNPVGRVFFTVCYPLCKISFYSFFLCFVYKK